MAEQDRNVSGHRQMAGLTESLLGNAANEFIESLARGESPTIKEYEEKYPEVADAIRDLFPALDLIGNSGKGHLPLGIENSGSGQRRQIGDFQLIGELGRGGMGVVYEAEQLSMGRRVALKVLSYAGLVDQLKIRRFQNEVRAVAALDHPNIVSVHMVGEERGVHYYAMQLIRGRNLAEVIHSLREIRDEGEELTTNSLAQLARREHQDSEQSDGGCDDPMNSAVSPSTADAHTEHAETVARKNDSTIPFESRHEYFRNVAAFAIQAARALQHAHDQGVIHRDIKPANLLIDNDAHLYVTDFGLARMEADAGVTATGDLIGTLRYMSPEQAQGNGVDVDHRTDIYSLAVTLYELLTFRPAYPTEDRRKLLNQIAFESPISLRRLDAEIPRDLEVVVSKAMSKERADRYASAKALADDLESFLNDRPIQAKPPTRLQRVHKWARRNPVLVWSTMLTMFLTTVILAISTLLVVDQWNEALAAEKRTRFANRQAADRLKMATVTRLASESRAWQSDLPALSVRLALEACSLAQQGNIAIPIADEALRNATQEIRKGRPLIGHETTISDVTMTSKWIVALGSDSNLYLYLWDTATEQIHSAVKNLQTDDSQISHMTVSGNGRWLVAAGEKLQRWDLMQASPERSRQVLAARDKESTLLSLSDDGRLLGVTNKDETATIWILDSSDNGETPANVHEFSGPIAVSQDGNWIANAPLAEKTIRLWRMGADFGAAESFALSGDVDVVGELAFSPDGQWLASSSSGSTVRLWNLTADPSEGPTLLPTGKNESVEQLKFGRDSKQLFANAFWGSQVLQWNIDAQDIASSKILLRGHTAPINELVTSGDGRWLVSGSSDGTVRFWSLENPFLAPQVFQTHDSVSQIALAPEGRWLISVGKKTALIWDLHGGDPSSSIFVMRGKDSDTTCSAAISSKGRWIATSDGHAVQLWEPDAKDRNHFSRQLQVSSFVESITISSNDEWLVAGCVDSTAHVWNLSENDIEASHGVLRVRDDERSNQKQIGAQGHVAICPNSRWVALGCRDQSVSMWDLTAPRDGESPHILRGHVGSVVSMKFSRDGRWLVTGSSAAHLWDLEADSIENSSMKLSTGNHRCNSIAIDANSRWLATIGPNCSVIFRDLKSNDPTTVRRVLSYTPGRTPASYNHEPPEIWRLAISPDAKWLLSARFDGTAQLWDLRDNQNATYVELPSIQDAAISSDGRWLASGCGVIGRLWDLTAANPATSVRILRGHTQAIWAVRFSEDSRWLITDSSDGTLRRWSLDNEWLVEQARTFASHGLTADEKTRHGIQELVPEK